MDKLCDSIESRKAENIIEEKTLLSNILKILNAKNILDDLQLEVKKIFIYLYIYDLIVSFCVLICKKKIHFCVE